MKNTSKHKTLRNTLAVAVAILGTALVIIGLWHSNQSDKETRKMYENATAVATVIEKYTRKTQGRGEQGDCFYVVAEHQATTEDNEKITFTQTYKMPWEDYIEIEIGDNIIAQYTPYLTLGKWHYISYEKTETKAACPACNIIIESNYCPDCGTPIPTE